MKMCFFDKTYHIDESAFIADDATIIGDVTIEENASVFFHSTLRGDSGKIVIGKGSNIQDGCILHCDEPYQVLIKANVTIGHGAIIHGAIIEDECLIVMGATVLNGAHLKKHTMIAAGALVKEGMVTKEGYLYAGVPAKELRKLTDEEIAKILSNAKHYQVLAKQYKEIFYGKCKDN